MKRDYLRAFLLGLYGSRGEARKAIEGLTEDEAQEMLEFLGIRCGNDG